MANPGPLWKCECSDCNCDNAAVKNNMEVDAVCHDCLEGVHKAERDYKASIETRKRIAKEERELKDE